MRTAVWVAGLALWVVGCGGGDLSLRNEATPTSTPGPDEFVTVTGNIASRSTFDPIEDIVVIACVDLPPASTDPTDWNGCPFQESEAADENGDFDITRVREGDLRVGFWISRSATPNGMIQSGDSFAELADPAAELLGVEDGDTVTLSEVAVDFGTGIATADIDVGLTPTPTPAANTTPVP